MNTLNIGLIGVGTVGSGLLEILAEEKAHILSMTGIELNLISVCDKDSSKIPSTFKGNIFSEYKQITEDPNIHMVVELVGGTGIALEIQKSAIQNGKYIITANKALLSEKGDELFSLAEEKNVEIGYEASVGGAIPLIRSIKTGLVSNQFTSILGILNGTTNFILTKMEEEEMEYDAALSLAQKLGFAEADPTFDVEGIDAAHKLSLVSSLAFNEKVSVHDISIEGISKISKSDIQAAKRLGLRIKLLAIAKKNSDGIEVRVSPTMIPVTHPIASVRNEMNAIYFETSYSGPSMLMGKGAGSLPTASAIISDLVFYGNRRLNNNRLFEKSLFETKNTNKILETKTKFYLKLKIVDKPGVLGMITSLLGKKNISIASLRQNESDSAIVELIILTHIANEKDLRLALNEIDLQKESVKEKSVMIRLEDIT